MLGCFVPTSYPLKIVMYTQTIKEEVQENNISEFHLFETVFAHEFFHALHFIVCMLKQLENKSFISDLCKRYGIGHSRIDKKTAEDIWKYIQQQTVNHMLDNGLDVRPEVNEPLAVAFEISWVKDRMVTQNKDRAEWEKIMGYEFHRRFEGSSTYPADPYYGGLYLVTTKSDRSTEADMQTINANISEVLKLSTVDMQKAYEHIQKLM